MSGIRGQGSESKVKRAICLFALCVLASGICEAKPSLQSSSKKHNQHAPIEITADKLEVFQAENKAIFTGHVVAIQAEQRLKGDQMIVYYKTEAEKDQAKNKKASPEKTEEKADDAGGNPLNAGSVKKIDVKGNVFLSTPEESASGDFGNYDVDAQLIHLNDHVVLTRGKNVLKGDKLVYNFETGKSVVSSNAPKAGGDKSKSERVRALFVPESKTKNATADKPEK
jgi:lipopolysaccharide export system protein LptA